MVVNKDIFQPSRVSWRT